MESVTSVSAIVASSTNENNQDDGLHKKRKSDSLDSPNHSMLPLRKRHVWKQVDVVPSSTVQTESNTVSEAQPSIVQKESKLENEKPKEHQKEDVSEEGSPHVNQVIAKLNLKTSQDIAEETAALLVNFATQPKTPEGKTKEKEKRRHKDEDFEEEEEISIDEDEENEEKTMRKRYNVARDRAKRTTAMKSSPREPLYCICRRPDIPGKLMIACDNCDEWFHGECIGISKEQADTITNYVCSECKRKQGIPLTKPSSPDGFRKCGNKVCSNPAKTNSKYCCDGCGIQAAKDLILQKNEKKLEEVLQQKLKSLETTIDSNVQGVDPEDLKKIQELEKQKEFITKEMASIDQKRTELEKAIEEAALFFATSSAEFYEDEKTDRNLDIMDCITCGQSISAKLFAQHVETCLKKVGTNGSSHKPLAKGFQLCGCPCSEFPSGYCLRLRKSCPKHVNWENVRKKALEQEKAAQFQRMESLLEQEKIIKTRISRRNTPQSTVSTITEG